EAEGVMSNVEFARRAVALNDVLGAFWTLGDLRGPLRLAALVAPVVAVAALLGVMLGGSPRMVPYAAAGIAAMAVALFAAGAYSYRPDRAVRSVLADWNAVDGPLRGLRWRSVRFTAELPAVSHRPTWVSWVIVLERLVVAADEDVVGEDSDNADGGGISVPLVDALPLGYRLTAVFEQPFNNHVFGSVDRRSTRLDPSLGRILAASDDGRRRPPYQTTASAGSAAPAARVAAGSLDFVNVIVDGGTAAAASAVAAVDVLVPASMAASSTAAAATAGTANADAGPETPPPEYDE
ncbi:hypothetical protein HK405_005909, partial [Cladochytrium tenue]